MALLKPGYYRVTKLLEPTVIELDETWFVRLKGVNENTISQKDKLSNWLGVGNYVKIIPHSRHRDASILSDVWLGSVYVNGSFSNYKNKESA